MSTAIADITDAARAIDQAAQVQAGGGPIDDAIRELETPGGPGAAPDPGAERKKDPRGRKKGGHNRSKSHRGAAGARATKDAPKVDPAPGPAPGAPGAAPDPEAQYLDEALAGLVFMMVEYSKANGYPSPGMGVMDDLDWCKAFSKAFNKVLEKYFPGGVGSYQAEFMLGTLVVPYGIAIVGKVMSDRRKDSRAPGRNGERENADARDSSAGIPPMDPHRSNDGQHEFRELRRVGPNIGGGGESLQGAEV
jgi:hypothetical protein